MKKMILASASPRRREILEQIGVKFVIAKSDFHEPEFSVDLLPEEYVKECARGKAENVADRFDDVLIIGADTIVVCENRLLGKPDSMADAFEYIKLLSGTRHDVYTGICIMDVCDGRVLTDYEKTSVTFRSLTDREISLYLSIIKPLDKAGAYAIQGPGAVIVESINGCYYNVVGLPVVRIEKMLSDFNTSFFQYIEG